MTTVIRMAQVVTVWHWLCVVMSAIFIWANVGVNWENAKLLLYWLVIAYAASTWFGDRLQRRPRLFGFAFMWFEFVVMWVLVSACGDYLRTGEYQPFSSNLSVFSAAAIVMLLPIGIALLFDLFSKKSTDLVKGDSK